MSSSSEFGDFDTSETVPAEIPDAAEKLTLNLLPEKSKRRYTIVYNEFKKWMSSKETNSFAEAVFLAYFGEISRDLSPTTLWSRYSMLKATGNAYNNIDMSKYKRLIAFLKKSNVGRKVKKAKVFTASNILKFCDEAPDDKYLSMKVALIIGCFGACRREELTNMTVKDIEDHNTFLFVHLPKTKTQIEHSFTIVGSFYVTCKKYMEKRPDDIKSDRFFLAFREGKYLQQPIGINRFGSMPKEIATFPELPQPELFTGHSFRRTSATLLVDCGADIATLKRHGGWKSNTVAEGYIEDSLTNKRKIGEQILNSISTNPAEATASTSDTDFHILPEPKRLKSLHQHSTPSTSTTLNQSTSVTPVPMDLDEL